jgi:hypothetical protein
MRVVKQKIKFKSHMHGFAIAAAFIFAQLLIHAHHVNHLHADNEDGVVVECDICTVSSGIFDAASHSYTPEVPNAERGVTLSNGDKILFETQAHSSYPRAPPQNI